MPTTPSLLIALWTSLAPTAEPKLTVRVYNYADVPYNTLSKSEIIAGHIFRRAAIAIEWLDCPRDRAEEERFPACRKPGTAADVILHVVAGSTEGYNVRHTAFGFALPSGECLPARHAYVLYRQVEEFARRSGEVSLETLLASVIVHEMGHLLLGPAMHAERGIMLPQWQPADLRDMERGRLVFTSAQSRELQARVQERTNFLACGF